MSDMFFCSQFNGDLSNWKPYKIESFSNMFISCSITIPYWAKFDDKEKCNIAINNYWLEKELQKDLFNNQIQSKKPKL